MQFILKFKLKYLKMLLKICLWQRQLENLKLLYMMTLIKIQIFQHKMGYRDLLVQLLPPNQILQKTKLLQFLTIQMSVHIYQTGVQDLLFQRQFFIQMGEKLKDSKNMINFQILYRISELVNLQEVNKFFKDISKCRIFAKTSLILKMKIK